MIAQLVRGRVAVMALSAAAFISLGGIAKADPVVPGEEHCVINVRSNDTLNIRSQPSAQASIVVRKAYADCGIMVHSCATSWCAVDDGHSIGWVNRRFIAMVSPALYCVTGVPPGDALNLRAFPSSQSRVLTQLGRQQCDIAFLPYAVGRWQKIRVSGWQGWVSRRYVSGE
jgi:SH3-like domain-containing protein